MIPLSVFVPMHDFIRCDNSPLDRGAPFAVTGMTHAAYIESIAAVIDARNNLVAWLYLAEGRVYVQANRKLAPLDADVLKLRFESGNNVSGVAGPLTLLPPGLRATGCSALTPTWTPRP